MNQETVTLCDLSGALTLPLFDKLLHKTKDIDKLRKLYQLLEFLYANDQKQMAFQLICLCFDMTGLRLPKMFGEMTRQVSAQADFAGEVLEDLEDILRDYE